MPSHLPASFVEHYARAPSSATMERVALIHATLQNLLGDGYSTVLQGSYKTETAFAGLNGVDIVAVVQEVPLQAGGSVDWERVFGDIERKLQSSPYSRGKWERQDKCIRLNAGYKTHIVPAITVGDPSSDPIYIKSWKWNSIRANWPRAHALNEANKSARTGGNFRKAVRLFKRHTHSQFTDKRVAPSYYLESLLYLLPDALFTGALAEDFLHLAQAAVEHHSKLSASLPRIAGDGDLFSADEWDQGRRGEYFNTLQRSLNAADRAINAFTDEEAMDAWRVVFNGHSS